MEQKGFTPQELYCMAQISGNNKMYGIANGFESVPEENLETVRLTVIDTLLDKHVLEMNSDGIVQLNKDYCELISFVCAADRCLIITYQNITNERFDNMVFWKKGKAFLRAEVLNDLFVFSPETESGIWEYINLLRFEKPVCELQDTFLIPKVYMVNAKKIVVEKGEPSAREYLLQHGAGRCADILLSGVAENADYMGMQLILDHSGDDAELVEYAWLFSNGALCALSEEIVNFRSCSKVSPCTQVQQKETIDHVLNRFVG